MPLLDERSEGPEFSVEQLRRKGRNDEETGIL
jgi:hypothetical protein